MNTMKSTERIAQIPRILTILALAALFTGCGESAYMPIVRPEHVLYTQPPSQPPPPTHVVSQTDNPFETIINTVNDTSDTIIKELTRITKMDGGIQVLDVLLSNKSELQKINDLWNLPPSTASDMLIETVWKSPNKIRKLSHSIKSLEAIAGDPDLIEGIIVAPSKGN